MKQGTQLRDPGVGCGVKGPPRPLIARELGAIASAPMMGIVAPSPLRPRARFDPGPRNDVGPDSFEELIHGKWRYVDRHRTCWQADDLDVILLELFPAKVIIEDDELDSVIPEAKSFNSFLAGTGLLDPGSDDPGGLRSHLNKLAGRFRRLMFILIIWLQGIWLPRHGYDFARTPLWAGLYMLPLRLGFLIAGPVSGFLSERYGSRPFATGGMLVAAGSFLLLQLLPINFSYVDFAPVLLLTGLAMGAFASPNRAGVMNSLPAEHRGVGAGMTSTFQSSAQVLSVGVFFTLIIIGLSATLPSTLYHGLVAHGVPCSAATAAAHLPPVSTLFAAFLGYNPVQHLLGSSVLAHLPARQAAVLTGRTFFPTLISGPFANGLRSAFDFSIGACLLASGTSWLRGGKYHYSEDHPDRLGETVAEVSPKV